MDIGCYICQEALSSLDGLCTLPCGHCFCRTCLQSDSGSNNCAVCRKPKGKAKLGTPLFPYTVDTSPEAVIAELACLDSSSSVSAVRRATKGFQRIIRLEGGHIIDLLNASKDLSERLEPAFAKLDSVTSENKDLKSRIADLQRKVVDFQADASQFKESSISLRAAKQDRKEALEEAQRNHSHAEILRTKVKRRDEALKSQASGLNILKQENESLQKALRAEKKRSALLARQLKSPKAKGPDTPTSENEDESLIIERSADLVRCNLPKSHFLIVSRLLIHDRENDDGHSKRCHSLMAQTFMHISISDLSSATITVLFLEDRRSIEGSKYLTFCYLNVFWSSF
ncbi:hypothetical protein DL96DRAFT_1582916 [Flagelloscypha sp. PMI_526]|nr:hypothetical protein DL96DRAFT_1582916 [Flagelloscypha sp. PMI_526]